MVLDSVHFEAMTDLLASVDRPGRDRDRRELAERIWVDGLADPSDAIPVTPIDEPRRYDAEAHELALNDRPFSQVAAIDAGSLNPTTFQNGLVVDVAHAAMATTPSDIDIHRHRTIIAAVHGPPAEVRSSRSWSSFDAGYGRARLVAAPSTEGEEETAVHALALERAEIDHALANRDDFGDLLLMDGSVYPASMLHWLDREGSLAQSLYTDRDPRQVVARAVELIDRCAQRDIPIVGVVKNWTGRGLVRGLRKAPEFQPSAIPWPTDHTLFQQLLAPDDPMSSRVCWSSWFTMEFGVGTALGYAIEELGLDADASAPAYDLGFMVVYDARENLLFRIEAPVRLLEDAPTREAITDHVLSGIAQEAGPPPTLRKADSLAKIARGERVQLKRELEGILTSTQVHRFDDHRWPGLTDDG